MKLIRFGSFPLVQIRKEEHECLDKYLLKHFSDSISFSNAITNLSIMKNTFYITPEKVIASMADNKMNAPKANATAGRLDDHEFGKHTGDYKNYVAATQRAFKILRTFYIQLSEAPFYKGMVYYPIYMEKYMRDNSSGGKISSQYKFNFVLLTNNLINDRTKELVIDEAAVINVLYIFIHLFKSDVLFNDVSRSRDPIAFSDFKRKHLVQVMRFYKLIQKFDLNPVTVFLAIYDLVSFAKQEFSENKTANFNNFTSRLSSRSVNKFDPDDTKFRGLVKIISNQITVELNRLKASDEFQSTEIILKIVETMLEHNEINDFVENLNHRNYSRDRRMELVADFNHYQPIIKIFEELVSYNELSLKDIIQDHDINFNKDIILTGDTAEANLTTIRGAIDRPLFDQSYKSWQDDCTTFISRTIRTIIERQLTSEINIFYNYNKNPEYAQIKNELNTILDQIDTVKEQVQIAQANLDALTGGIPVNPSTVVNPTIIAARRQLTDAQDAWARLNQEYANVEARRTVIVTQMDTLARNATNEILGKIEDKFDTLVTAFGNIYEDLSNIFLNPLMMNLFFTNDDIRKLFNLGESGFNMNCIDLYTTLTKFSEIKLKIKTSSVVEKQSLEVLDSLIQQLTVDIRYLMDMYLNLIDSAISTDGVQTSLNPGEDKLKALLSKADYDQLTVKFLEDCYKKLCNYIWKPMLLKLSRVQVREQNELQYSHELNDLHPVLGKMARNINNFKSFIFGITTLETLYDLIVLTKEKLFYNGLLRKPVVRLNTPEAKIKYILDTVLGLSQNTVWVIGGGKVRLSMPDYLAITGIPFTSDIKQSQLRSICKLDPKKWWSEVNISNDYDFNGKVQDLTKEKEAVNRAAKDVKDNDTLANREKLKRARDILNKKQKELENKLDLGLGNIGLNITKDAKTSFYGSGGFGDQVEHKIKEELNYEQYLEKVEELRNKGMEEEEISKEIEAKFSVIDSPINVPQPRTELNQNNNVINQPYVQPGYDINAMRQQMQNDPRSYIDNYSRRDRY